MPRTPRNGLSSGGIGSAGSGLSAPASSVRTISGRPPSAAAISRSVCGLLVLAGQLVAAQEQELGAQQADALGARAPPRGPRRRRCRGWRTTSIRVAVTRDARARGRARARRRAARCGRARGAPCASLDHVVGRVDHDRARLAVEQQRRAVGDRRAPRARGRPRRAARARGRGWRRARWWSRARWRCQDPLGVEARRRRPGSARRRRRCPTPSAPSPSPRAGERSHHAPRRRRATSAARSCSRGSSSAAVARRHLLGGVVPRALGGGAGAIAARAGLEQRLVVEQRRWASKIAASAAPAPRRRPRSRSCSIALARRGDAPRSSARGSSSALVARARSGGGLAGPPRGARGRSRPRPMRRPR